MHSFFVVEDERGGESAVAGSVGMSEELAGESMAAIADLITRLDSGSSDLVDFDFHVPSGSEPCSGPKPHRETSAHMNPMTEQSSRPRQPAESPDVELVERHSRRSQTVRSQAVRSQTEKNESGATQNAEAFAVADYLQLAGMSRRSVELIVQGPEGAQGRIVVADGLVMTAEDAQGSGSDAFGRLAMMNNVAVECRPLQETPAKAELLGVQVDELLLEAARRRDEQQQGRPQRAASATPDKASGGSASYDGGEQGSGARMRSDVVRTAATNPSDARSVEVLTPMPVGAESATRGMAAARADGRAERVARPQTQQQPQRRATNGAPSAKKEATVNATTAVGTKPKAESILATAPALSALARAASDGSVLEVAGEMDAETTCAVVALAGRQLEEVAAELGLGDVQAWHMGLGDSTWYVVSAPTEMLVVRGEPAKNPASVLQKIENGWRR